LGHPKYHYIHSILHFLSIFFPFIKSSIYHITLSYLSQEVTPLTSLPNIFLCNTMCVYLHGKPKGKDNATKTLTLDPPTQIYFSINFTRKRRNIYSNKKITSIQPSFRSHLLLKVIRPSLSNCIEILHHYLYFLYL
jgi:hypothetical protein